MKGTAVERRSVHPTDVYFEYGLSVYLSTIYFSSTISLFPVTCAIASIARLIKTYWLSE